MEERNTFWFTEEKQGKKKDEVGLVFIWLFIFWSEI